MSRPTTAVAVPFLVVTGLSVPAGGTVTDLAGPDLRPGEDGTASSNDSAAEAAPGATLAGVVEVHEAAVEDELAGRAFEVQIARAESPAERAAIVAERLDALTRRTATLREEKRTLGEARANGSLPEPRVRAEMAGVGARSVAVSRRLDQVETTARTLPAAVLEANGVSASAIETLRREAHALTASDVEGLARSIAGSDVGAGLAGGNASSSAAAPNSTVLEPPSSTASGTGDRPAGDETPTTLPGTPDVPTDGGNVSRTTDEPR